MTPTMEDVAGWLKEAAILARKHRAILLERARFSMVPEAERLMDDFNQRASQVEALSELKTCDTCLYWATSSWKTLPEIGICNFPEKKNDISQGLVYQCGPKFGCIHYEDKQQIKDLGVK